MLFSFQGLCSWISKHQNPKRAISLSSLLTVASFCGASFLAFKDGFGFIGWQFFSLVGLSIFCSLARSWTTELTKSGNSDVGFSWLDLGGIPMMLATIFLSPVAGFLTATASIAVMPLLKVRWRAIPTNFVTSPLLYLLVGIGFSAVVNESTPLAEKIFFILLASFLVETLSCLFYFTLRTYMDGNLAFDIDSSSIYFPTGVLIAITTVLASAISIFGFVIPLVILTVCLALTPIAELVIRLRMGVDGQRALSWGMAAAVFDLLGRQDPRLRRHSVNVARYMRDFAKELKLPRGVQELAFMYGLLHDIGLAALKPYMRCAEEEFLRDDAPPAPEPGEKTFQWEPPENVAEDDHIGQAIHQAKDTYEALGGKPGEGMKEPAWWRSEEAKTNLSLEDIDQLECHDINGGILLQSAAKHGCLPELIANHHQPPVVDYPRTIKEKLLHMMAVCDRYESLTAIDGSFPAKQPEDALIFLEEYADSVFHRQAFDVFCKMMRKKPAAYRNGTDIDYESQLHLEDFLDRKLPSAFNVIGWLKFGLVTPNAVNAISSMKKR